MVQNAQPIEPLFIQSTEELRDWFEQNHRIARELWLAMPKGKNPKRKLVLKPVVDEAICFGWIDVKIKRYSDQYYLLRLTPRKKASLWSLQNRLRAESLMAEGRMAEAGLEKIEEAIKNGQWYKAYTSRCKPEIPRELEEALSAQPAAIINFSQLAPSYQQQYCHWVSSARTEVTRTKRIEKVVNRSIAGLKPGIDM